MDRSPLSFASSSMPAHPELAMGVGRIVGGYSHLEYMLYMIFCAASDEHPDTCFASFYSLIALQRKLELVTEEFGYRLDDQMTVAWNRLQRRLKSAARKRTQVAHSQFLKREDGIVRIVRDKDGKPNIEPIAQRFFDYAIRQYQLLGADLGLFLALIFQSRPWRADVLPQLPSAPENAPQINLQPLQDHELESLEPHIKDALARLGIELSN